MGFTGTTMTGSGSSWKLQPDGQRCPEGVRGVKIPAVFKMNQSASSMDGAEMEARQQLLGGLLQTGGCTLYKRSTAKLLQSHGKSDQVEKHLSPSP